MVLVKFSSNTVDRRVPDRSLNCYFWTFESRAIKLEINFDLLSIYVCFWRSIKEDIPVERVIFFEIDLITIKVFGS
jgi:hypothetical protein